MKVMSSGHSRCGDYIVDSGGVCGVAAFVACDHVYGEWWWM